MPTTLPHGKVTLVTGGGGGIGRATALVLAREGAKVMVSNVSTRRGEETVALVRQAGGAADVEALIGASSAAGAGWMERTTMPASPANLRSPPRTPRRTGTTLAVDLKGVWLCMKYEILQCLRRPAR
jgi:NAD(P)-dependent dehydrogenase (short-subunit alcohol dehydrogenase family)